ncbi:peroxidase 28-like [Senna tora]|uniref:peroxidase n=1 Tax=Senna tora TaxID=362788 RepID=A0A834T677_9FABA|nr:peroxidase 28-like [Senna tora]
MARACFVNVMIMFSYLNLITNIPSYYADEQNYLFSHSLFNPGFPRFGSFQDYDDQNQHRPFIQSHPIKEDHDDHHHRHHHDHDHDHDDHHHHHDHDDADEQLHPLEENEKQEKNPKNTLLVEGFYRRTCPNAEQIVANQVAEIVKTNPTAIAALIRLHFHDCFVGGCDASILLDTLEFEEKVEKLSPTNGQLLKGADLIDDIKAKLEEECPGIVSCADTIAFAAIESMTLGGLPPQPKLGGRRDSLSSRAAEAEDNLPFPNWSMDQMLNLFKKKGFNAEDMVALNGAHSVGSAHCNIFNERLYNYSNTGRPDPTLDLVAVDELKKICKPPGSTNVRDNPTVNFDETPTVIDNLLYKNLVEKRKALLETDQAMANDKRTALFVKRMAEDPNLFPVKFGEVMSRMGSLGVLTGKQGEVRTTCRSTT